MTKITAESNNVGTGVTNSGSIDYTALNKIGYGLYAVTSNDGKKDNALIVNTVMQVTNTPNRIAVVINKANYSHDVIKESGKMNINCLDESTPFSIFEKFGFCSGRDNDKFNGMDVSRSSNGLVYLKEHINSFISLCVESYTDMDTHGMFVCTIDEAQIVGEKETMTYSYYHQNVKPKSQASSKKGYVCKICGYVYEGDELPDDYVCPICKHGAEDFEPLK